MKIFNSLGLGIFFIILLLLMPAVFIELARTITVFLQSAQKALLAAGAIASYAGQIPSSVR